jgi:hypothetical protein
VTLAQLVSLHIARKDEWGGATLTGGQLRLHVLALAAEHGVLVRERPMRLFDAEAFPDGHVECPPITDVVTYFVALHGVAHHVMAPVDRVVGAGELEREWHAHAWARDVALVEPDVETRATLARALASYE